MLNKMKQNLPSIVTALIGISIFLLIPSQIDISQLDESARAGINSRTIPYVLSLLIIFLSILEIVFSIVKNRDNKNVIEKSNFNIKAYVRVVVTIGLIIAWMKLFPILGFTISTILLLVAIMLIMGNRTWYLVVIVPFVTSITLKYIFTEFVGRSLPTCIFF
ncbi:MAG: tripartite tricarboxylate transporter TctB family protein [Pleomorphochaeta sp.]